MKKIIQKINTFLIEKYPVFWNTKIVWFAGISLLLHLLFFIAGYVIITDVTLLQKRSAIDTFLTNGTVFFAIIVSILQIIIWLIFLFKNNGFKEFYPTKKFSLFLQFILYFFCFFISTSYYISYTWGLKASVLEKYPKEVLLEDVETANKAALFFSHELKDYTINNIYYPHPLDSLFCETRPELIDESQPNLAFKKKSYQFYKLKKVETLLKDNNQNYNDGQVFVKQTDSSVIKFFKDTVVAVLPLIKTSKPSYFNFSKTFYELKYFTDKPIKEYNPNNRIFYNEYDNEFYDNDNSKERFETNKNGYLLLEKKNSKLVERNLQNFLQLAEKYKINNNISLQQWMDIVYHPDLFEVTALIRDAPKLNNDYNFDIEIDNSSEFNIYENEIRTDYFIETDKLNNVFSNIEAISSTNIFIDAIVFFLWIGFLLASVLFAFRVTGLKTLLFAIILGGVLTTLAALITVIFDFVGSNFELLIQYTFLVMLLIIFAIPIFLLKKVRKSIQGVFVALTITNFASFIFLIISIISTYQRNKCLETHDYSYTSNDCFVLIEYLGYKNVGYIILLLAVVFIFMYTTIIKRWRALPES